MNATEGDMRPNTSADDSAAGVAVAVGSRVGDGVEVCVGVGTTVGPAGSGLGTGDGVWVWTRIGTTTWALSDAETVSGSRCIWMQATPARAGSANNAATNRCLSRLSQAFKTDNPNKNSPPESHRNRRRKQFQRLDLYDFMDR